MILATPMTRATLDRITETGLMIAAILIVGAGLFLILDCFTRR